MNLYTVAGMDDVHFGIVPDVPTGTAWAAAYDAASNTYLIATPAALSSGGTTTATTTTTSATAVTDLASACATYSVQVNDCVLWQC